MLNEGLVELEDDYDNHGVFQGCGICEITLPETMMYIGSNTFSDCGDLTKIYLKGKYVLDLHYIHTSSPVDIVDLDTYY